LTESEGPNLTIKVTLKAEARVINPDEAEAEPEKGAE
jgi:hypothetical protein